MYLRKISAKGFRLLDSVEMSIAERSTLVVGRNNSGKTSLMELCSRFLGRKLDLKLEDFSIVSLARLRENLQDWKSRPKDKSVLASLPAITMTLLFDYKGDVDDLGPISSFVVELDETCTEIKLRMSYEFARDDAEEFLEHIDASTDAEFSRTLAEAITTHYSSAVTSIDPNNEENFAPIDLKRTQELLRVDFIHAQRGLDDDTRVERDRLGAVVGTLFKSAESDYGPEDWQDLTSRLNEIMANLQSTLDGEFKEQLARFLPALKIFGYPGLSDPEITTETVVELGNLLEERTKVKYRRTGGLNLPESYNGLGSRNLILILLQLFAYYRGYQTSEVRPRNHLVFIEEPEAHLHPQMQEAFVRQLDSVVGKFVSTFGGSEPWPVQFVVSTHSSHIANEADFRSIRYFRTRGEDGQARTEVKDLGAAFPGTDQSKTAEFMQKYLTLTKCDLLFADKAVLFEGPTERILMPFFVRSLGNESEGLASQYVSYVEVGGAYLNLFFEFVDFLEIRTLLVTDLDSVGPGKNGGRAKSLVSDGKFSSNAAIRDWFGTDDLQKVLASEPALSIKGLKRICFQVPEQDTGTIRGRSFEEAMILANRELYSLEGETDRSLEEKASQTAERISSAGKVNLAMELAIKYPQWATPKYIRDGLDWLSRND